MSDVEASSELRRQLLERLRRGELPPLPKPADPPIQPAARETTPLSCGQQQLWLHSEFAPGAPIYNESITLRKTGPLNPGVLQAAFNAIVARHAIWRTGFSDSAGAIVQIVHPQVHVPLPLLDLTHLPRADAEAEALRLAGDDARRLFDLAQPPLLRARLVRLAPDDHRLYLTFHHLVFDGVSVYRVLLPELAALYRAFLAGQPSPLAALPIQYGDYAVWQQSKVSRGDYAAQLNFWRDALKSSAPPLVLPLSHARPLTPTWRAGMESFAFPAELSREIKQFAAREGVTVFMTLLAAFHVLLSRYSGQSEIATGAVVSTRNRPEIEPLIGFLLNTVVFRSRVHPDLSFRDFLNQVRDTVLNALANSDVPFDAVVRELAPRRDSSRNAFFQILFSLRPSSAHVPDGWDIGELDVHSGASGFDLFVDLLERPDNLVGRIVYSANLFDGSAIARMAGHLQTLLAGIVATPALPVSRLPLLPEAERRALFAAGEGPSMPPPAATVAAMFQRIVEQFPTRIAVQFQSQALTFQELDRRAAAFASRLREAGAQPGALVSISIERSLELVIALIGVQKTGAAYLPVDPHLPAARREFILQDAQAHLHVSSAGLHIERAAHPPGAHSPGLAYVLYTSGSTGVPKGVEVPETALVNFLASMQREPGFPPSGTLLAVTTLSFDIAALEIFLPLVSGGTLVLAPQNTAKDPLLLMDAMRESHCTVMQATPALWRSLIDAGWRGDPNLKILCGGEALQRGLADALLPRCRELWNLYGPTETTIWSTLVRVEPAESPVPLGRPIANTRIYVVDPQQQLVPTGIPGELLIGGSGVAIGYANRPALTAERFLPDPFHSSRRVYRTGDLVRWSPAGALEFLGRSDNQVKVRGFRIELQEIEEALVKYPGVRGAAVRAWPDSSGENSLVAYIEGPAAPEVLRPYLAGKLPDYMIPSRFIPLAALPLTPNGKIDRNALPQPDRSTPPATSSPSDAPSGPRTAIEQRLTALWTELLHTPTPDIHQDFFELGGHSLLAASLLRRIHLEFGRPLGISALFEHPTIAGLAALLAPAPQDASSPGGLAAEAASGEQTLYWMYAGAYCRHLASRLRPAFRLYGVALPPDVEPNVRQSDTLENVARMMVAEMQAHRPHGPYKLGGWCISGILAYEVAVQLEALGEHVDVVALLGAPNPRHYTSVPRLVRLKSKLRHHWNHVIRLDAAGVSRYLSQRALRQVSKRNPLRSRQFDGVLVELALRYRPKPLRARVVLFQAIDRPAGMDYAPGWTDVVQGQFSEIDVPGNHATSLEEPNVAVLAEKLQASLR